MKRKLFVVAMTTLAVLPATAQESADIATSATAATVTAVETSSSAAMGDDTTTGAAGNGRRSRMQGMDFERRWERTEASYKKAGIPDEKIEQLKALDKRVFDSLQSGEKIDFAAIREERNKVLGEEEQEKLRKAREDMAGRMRSGAGNSQTTAPANQ